ncbi:hypothetical protein [Paraburkholderia caffeinilytica]|uniref:hypothetical protein n=1 Tax=Paraburkholderia caffeinilytica TaxID=1761016 RepID=UPI0013BEA086|nr:hypothetical protein [Paraburkholderia caffeinilytica]
MQALKKTFVFDFKKNSGIFGQPAYLPHCKITFHNANVLASHKGASYNQLHRLQQFCNLRCLLHLLLWWIKPEPLVRVFFRPQLRSADAGFGAGVKGKWWYLGAGSPGFSPEPPQVLTRRDKFLYNSELFRIRARGGRTRESLHAPRCAHYKQEKNHWAQQFFWIDHEDVFRKSP